MNRKPKLKSKPINAKPPVFASPALAYAMDKALSKAALIDLVIDLLRRQHGSEEPEEVLAIELDTEYLPPVFRERQTARPVSIQKAMQKFTASGADYVARNERLQQETELDSDRPY